MSDAEVAEFFAVVVAYLATAGKGLTDDDLRKSIAVVAPEQANRVVEGMAERWRQQGWRDSILDGIKLALNMKFGSDGLRLWPEIRQITDANELRAVLRAIKAARTPAEIRGVYQGAAG